MPKSMTYDGTNLADYGLQVTEYDVPELADIEVNKHMAIFGDSEFTSVNFTTRTIRVECTVKAGSKAELQSNMDSIKRLLNPILTDKVITLDAIEDRRFIGRLEEMGAPSVKARWAFSFRMIFVCMADMQSVNETNASTAIATDPDTLTISAPDGSTSRIPTEFYVRNETGATLTSVTIILSNDTTNESITWKGTIQDDYWLRIGSLDSNGRHKSVLEISTTNGSDVDILEWVSAEVGYQSGDWPRLKGGVANDITVTGISTGTLEHTYRDRYL